jgi:transcriptional regulator with XRE-family HTH domain
MEQKKKTSGRGERLRIGRRIAEIRKEQNLTQTQLAERCGLQQAHIARIETGRYSVGLDTLAQIADAMGMKIDFITNN